MGALLAAAILFGSLLRFQEAARRMETEDFQLDYYSLGLSLTQQHLLAYPTQSQTPTAFRGGLYPSFLALISST